MKKCLLLAWILVCLCGCGRTDRIAHQTIVTALEIAPAEIGWRLSVEYLQQTPPDQPAAYGVLTGEGKELHLALSAIEQQSGRSLYLENCRALLIACPPDTNLFRQLLEEADKTLKLRPTIPVAVISQSILSPQKDPEFFTGGEADRFFSNNRRMEGGKLTLKDHLNTLRDDARCTATVILELEEEQLVRKGTVFWGQDHGIVVPWQKEILLPLSITGRGNRWAVLRNGEMEVELEKLTYHIGWEQVGKVPMVTVTINCQGELRWTKDEQAQLQDARQELEELLQSQGEKMWEEMVIKEKIDFLDAGKALSWQFPQWWKTVKENWPDFLQDASYRFYANAELSDPSGLLEGSKILY